MKLQAAKRCSVFSNKTGTIIIAVLGILGGLSMMGEPFMKPADKAMNRYMEQLDRPHGVSVANAKAEKEFVLKLKVMAGMFEIFLSLSLIHAVVQEIAGLLILWIMINAMQTCLGTVAMVYVGVNWIDNGLVLNGTTTMFSAGFIATLQIFFMYVVFSYSVTVQPPQTNQLKMITQPMTQA